MTTNLEILEALETLAAAFPWDTVEIQVDRAPAGTMCFSAWLRTNSQFGFSCELACGDSPGEAVARLIKTQSGKRDPDKQRKKKIAELREEIEKLQAVVIGLPPYKPNRELAQVNLPPVPATIDV